MKKSERALLDDFNKGVSIPYDDTLKNVREAIGNVNYVVGNPLTKTEILLQIFPTFYQNGVLINEAALPAALRTFVPVYIFGFNDFTACYAKMNTILPPVGGFSALPQAIWFRQLINISCFVEGFNAVSANNQNLGDLVMIYTAFIGVNTYLCVVKVRCLNISYATFLYSFTNDLIVLKAIRYIVPVANINQFDHSLIFAYQSLFGKLATDTIDPKMFTLNTDFQNQICDIPINLPIDKNLMLGFNMNTNTTVNLLLNISKVESYYKGK